MYRSGVLHAYTMVFSMGCLHMSKLFRGGLTKKSIKVMLPTSLMAIHHTEKNNDSSVSDKLCIYLSEKSVSLNPMDIV